VSTWAVWYQLEGGAADLPPVRFDTFEAACHFAAWLLRLDRPLVGKPRIARRSW
jgi:hypothetical protein